MARRHQERQEYGMIRAIQESFRKNKRNPITIKAGKTTLPGVINAKKYSVRQISGAEPYTDVIVTLYDKKNFNLSLKGETSPSLAGGGFRGVDLVIPGLVGRFMRAVFNYLVNVRKLNPGDKVPDIYGTIDQTHKVKIVVGNRAMGGPIDYMYIGPMDLRYKYDEDDNLLQLNGNLIDSEIFAKTHSLYFYLRARKEDQRFDPLAKQAGVPKIYGRSPGSGDSSGRLAITDRLPKNAIIIKV